MPQVQSIQLLNDENGVQIGVQITTKQGGIREFLWEDIPPNFTEAQIENFANNWLENNITNVQMRFKVLGMDPFYGTIGSWDLGVTIPDNWWMDPE
jgi:hypothetical protein